jgi:hypothetical protein
MSSEISESTSSPIRENSGFLLGFKLWPLPPYVAVGMMCALMRSSQYLNRGFTVWFHLVALLYLLTQSRFVAKFQALIGTSICLGWYAALIYDWFQYSNFFLILYRNMPTVMKEIMFVQGTNSLNLACLSSINVILLSHILDTLGHPLLTLYFWRQHQKQGGTLATLLSWDVIMSTWIFSRCWSLTHTYYNFGKPGLYYFGYDVYVIDEGTLDLWYPAYIVESLFYFSIVVWKQVGKDQPRQKASSKSESAYKKTPNLLWSESGISYASINSCS